jgi:hypothetical protein
MEHATQYRVKPLRPRIFVPISGRKTGDERDSAAVVLFMEFVAVYLPGFMCQSGTLSY